MFSYYLRLAWVSLKKTPGISALMVAAIAIGIGVTTTTLTVWHMMSSNPIEHRNDVLYAVTMDSWDPNRPYDDDRPALAPEQLTYRDAEAVRTSGVPDRVVVMRKGGFTLESTPDRKPWLVIGRFSTRDFFDMFDAPFRYGGAWDAKADRDGEPVVVLSEDQNEKAFGGENSVGRTVKLNSIEYRVVGVLKKWQPKPKFYDLTNGAFNDPEDVWIPYVRGALLETRPEGNVNCWKPEAITDFKSFSNSECIWIQAWVELRGPAKVQQFQAWMDGYVAGQKKLGRFPRKTNNVLYTPEQWLERGRVVREDNRVLLGLSFMFLAVCVLNVVGLLLSKFLGAAGASALRRALGASRGDLFRQHLVEVGTVGALGGLFGLLLAFAGLKGMNALYDGYEQLTRLDLPMIGAAIGIAILAGVVAGLYPAWRVCSVQPASYLKTQ
jgi:putative ABC transport system permease protein